MQYKKLGEKPLRLELITAGEETQMRYATRNETVKEYAERFETDNAWPFDTKLIVFYDGDEYWLADGFHRFEAATMANRTSVHCIIYDGTIDDAQDYALQANASHGLRRTNEDKRKAVTAALSMDRWASKSDRAIAEHIGVSHTFVSKVRDMVATVATTKIDPVKTEVRVGRDGVRQPVKAKTAADPAPPNVPPTSMSEPDEDYEDFEPSEAVEPRLELAEHLEPIRAKLLTHFELDELPTSESHYKAIARLGVDGAIDVVELAREQMTGDSPKLQDYRDAAKSLDAKYAKSILMQHLEAAMRGTDDLNRHTPNEEDHTYVMDAVQAAWEIVKGWK